MNVLVIGSGGREHTLVWKLSKSPLVNNIYCIPGNGGISDLAECIQIPVSDFNKITGFAREKDIKITIVGPEAPLVDGITDVFEEDGLKIFGPTKKAAEIEGSKVFANELTKKYKIPAPEFEVFQEREKLIDYLKGQAPPYVIKADGLAAGKGVLICKTLEEGIKAADIMFIEKKFGSACESVIVEECLVGEETSILAITDGEDYILFPSSQDHKRAFDNDEGPNTGGMGAYGPAPLVTDELLEKIKETIIAPTIHAMKEEGRPYKGVLYYGLMVSDGIPKVLEYNCRFGDPETQVVLPLLKSDLMETLLSAIDGKLNTHNAEYFNKAATCVVLASGGYPGSYEKGKEITGLDLCTGDDNEIIFHAGTVKKNGKFYTGGGRVLGITYLGNDLKDSIRGVYDSVKKVNFEKMQFRTDIGKKGLKRLGF